MKLQIITILLVISMCSIGSNAQIQIGNAKIKASPKAISEADKEAFKKTKTYFLLRNADYAHKEAFEAMLAKNWTVTPFKILDLENDKIEEENYSIFSFGGFAHVSVSEHYHKTALFSVSYDLTLVQQGKKNQLLAKVMMSPDYDMNLELYKVAIGKEKDFTPNINKIAYGDGVFNNWSPLFMGAYLKYINDHIITLGKLSSYDKWLDEEKINDLKTDTLYIPDYIKQKISVFNYKKSLHEEDKLTKVYPYPCRFVSNEELEHLAANRPGGIRFLCYIQNMNDKHITVIDSKDYSIWFTGYASSSYNFDENDLGLITRKMRK